MVGKYKRLFAKDMIIKTTDNLILQPDSKLKLRLRNRMQKM